MTVRPGPAAALLALGLLLAGCSSSQVTTPARTATEQLLISTAADKAAERLAETLSVTGSVYVDSSSVEGYDNKYAISAIRDALLRRGARLSARDAADTVVELRVGALSVDSENSLVGIPSITMPLPMANNASTPEISLFKKELTQGVAKVAGTAYDRKTGALVASSGPQYGFSNKAEWVLLLLLRWETNDLLPSGERPQPAPWESMEAKPAARPERANAE
ncbi:DUF6655 family protein [Azospirillum doebereinerae]|uniref:DUF6655 family protein n=1 Tax=Azospirillum doebereinerae TaxID=92933 RepID=UPI001EE5323A|nr:DUF6655 family protein [Azospirillum doebereinerae]MCG5239884.1 hypothetical protein [Azospirillum doebereinerae]